MQTETLRRVIELLESETPTDAWRIVCALAATFEPSTLPFAQHVGVQSDVRKNSDRREGCDRLYKVVTEEWQPTSKLRAMFPQWAAGAISGRLCYLHRQGLIEKKQEFGMSMWRRRGGSHDCL